MTVCEAHTCAKACHPDLSSWEESDGLCTIWSGKAAAFCSPIIVGIMRNMPLGLSSWWPQSFSIGINRFTYMGTILSGLLPTQFSSLCFCVGVVEHVASARLS
jgi:hypothetical protein